MSNPKELTIDINQYIQWDEDDKNIIYFRESSFLEQLTELYQEYMENLL